MFGKNDGFLKVQKKEEEYFFYEHLKLTHLTVV